MCIDVILLGLSSAVQNKWKLLQRQKKDGSTNVCLSGSETREETHLQWFYIVMFISAARFRPLTRIELMPLNFLLNLFRFDYSVFMQH